MLMKMVILFIGAHQVWVQKSRLKWLVEGDRNSGFFHKVCRVNALRRNLANLKVGEETICDQSRLKEAISGHFKSFFSSQNCLKPNILPGLLNQISAVQAELLEMEFTENEAWSVISDSDRSKAPGPDGFNMNFSKLIGRLSRRS